WIPGTTLASRCRTATCASGPGSPPASWKPAETSRLKDSHPVPGGLGLAVSERLRSAGRGQRPDPIPAGDERGDRALYAGPGPARPEAAVAGTPRSTRRRPRSLARSGAAARHTANAILAPAGGPFPLPIVMGWGEASPRCPWPVLARA